MPICFQHLSLTNLAFLPCLYYTIYLSENNIPWTYPENNIPRTYPYILIKGAHKQQVNQRLIKLLYN